MLYPIFFLFLIFTTHSISANQQLSIAEVVSISLENHPQTRQAWWNAQRASAALGLTKSAYYPQFDLVSSAIHGRDFKFINGPDTNYTIFCADVTLALLLYDFGGRDAEISAARNALLAANWQTNWIMQKVIIDTLENSYSLLHAQEVYQAAKISESETEKMLSLAQELNKAGLTPVSDLYTSEATLAEMRMNAVRQKAALEIQQAKLAKTIGINTNIDLLPINTLPEPPKEQIATLLEIASQQRADLLAKQAELQISSQRYKAAQAACYPTLSINGRGGAEHAVKDKAHGAHYEISLNLEMPLFDGFANCYQRRKAFAEKQISIEELAELELEIAFEVFSQRRRLQAAQEMLCHAEETLRNAHRAYDGVLALYRAGKERISELSHAQRQLAQARVIHSEVKTQWLISLASLAYATGSLAPYLEESCSN